MRLSSFCTVFAGTELLTLIRAGRRPADLARAAYQSLVKRILAMDVFEGRLVTTGGVVACHPTVVALLAEQLRTEVTVPPYAQEIGAFGAALAGTHAGESAQAQVVLDRELAEQLAPLGHQCQPVGHPGLDRHFGEITPLVDHRAARGQQAHDGDGQTAHRGDQRLADADARHGLQVTGDAVAREGSSLH